MAISVPYSLELTKLEDAKDATEGSDSAVVAGKMKIFLTTTVTPEKLQTVVGSLKVCFRRFMSDAGRGEVTADTVAYDNFNRASSGTVTIAADDTGVSNGDVGISVSSTFSPTGESQYMSETFDQLINVLLEKGKDT